MSKQLSKPLKLLLFVTILVIEGCALFDSPEDPNAEPTGKPRRGAITWESGR
jgi:hypothetical protein